MLPQIKRPQHDDGEVEIEVVDVRNVDGSNISDDDPTMLASNAALKKELAKGGAHPSARASHSTSSAPSHLKKGVFGDEPTQLMPVKKNAAALMPQPDRPASQRPNSGRPGSAMSSSLPEARSPGRASSRAPSPNSERPRAALDAAMPRIPMHAPPPSFNMRDREDSHTSLRPMSGLSEEAQKVLAESKAAAASMAVPSAGAIKAQVDAARAKRLSDQRARAAETLEVTPVSISERFVVQGRPAAPWAIAFVAMGIFAGITTVVFTGGRASAIAAFIDPAHEAPAVMAAPATVAAAAPLANDPAANLLPGAMAGTQANPQAVTGAPVDIAPMTPTVFAVGRASNTQTAQPQVAAAPVQVAAPTPHATPKPQADPTPAPRPAPVAVSKPDPKPAPAPVVAAADPKPAAADTSKPSSHHSSSSSKKPAGGGGDVDSAAAADALAKAQLENSL